MDKVQVCFLESLKHELMVLFRYIDDLFFISIYEEELPKFPKELNKTHSNVKFTHESSKEKILFLDLLVNLPYGKLYTDLHINATNSH